MSQGGPLIKTGNWQCFQEHDRVVLTFFLPPFYTGQYKTIALHGAAVVTRIDQIEAYLALEFSESLKQFASIRNHEEYVRERNLSASSRSVDDLLE